MVWEVMGRGGNYCCVVGYVCLVIYIQGIVRDFDMCFVFIKYVIVVFFGQLCGIYMGWWCYLQVSWQLVFVVIQQFIGGMEVVDVGYVGVDEYFVDFFVLYIRQQVGIVWIVWCVQNWFFNICQIDVDYCCVFCVSIGFQQLWICQLFFYVLDMMFQGMVVVVVFGDYLFQQNDVGVQIFNDWFFIQFDGVVGGRMFC